MDRTSFSIRGLYEESDEPHYWAQKTPQERLDALAQTRQGGFGIQTAPAAARLAAQVLLGLPKDGTTARIDPAVYSPARFASR